jgi:cytochrome c oxidase assembly factor CtaG
MCAAGRAQRGRQQRQQLGHDARGHRDRTLAPPPSPNNARLRQSRALAVDSSWSWDPGPLIALAGAMGIYIWRWRAARAEGGARAASAGRLALFAGGILALFAALVSPVDRLSERVFVFHMTQHLLLLDVAAILLILGLTKVILRPATRRVTELERRAGILAHPVTAVVLYVATMGFWHVPALYDAALAHPGVHVLEHMTFAGAGLLYWWHLLSPIRSRRRLGGMGPVLYMASTKLAVGLLGIVITFAPETLYPHYASGDRLGLTPAEDQGAAGALMALEQSVIMGIALAAIFIRMLGESERDEQRAERYEREVGAAG